MTFVAILLLYEKVIIMLFDVLVKYADGIETLLLIPAETGQEAYNTAMQKADVVSAEVLRAID